MTFGLAPWTYAMFSRPHECDRSGWGPDGNAVEIGKTVWGKNRPWHRSWWRNPPVVRSFLSSVFDHAPERMILQEPPGERGAFLSSDL